MHVRKHECVLYLHTCVPIVFLTIPRWSPRRVVSSVIHCVLPLLYILFYLYYTFCFPDTPQVVTEEGRIIFNAAPSDGDVCGDFTIVRTAQGAATFHVMTVRPSRRSVNAHGTTAAGVRRSSVIRRTSTMLSAVP